ncbi:hypothetical protein ACQ4PT_031425 [Festuca glaucescens]
MEANGGGGGLPNGVGDHALPNGVGDHAPADHALVNGALPNGAGQANHALANGALANHAVPNGALANGGGDALANGAVANGGLQVMAAPNGVLPARVLYRAFLCLPAQEIARCRMICRLWRDITGTEDFRRDHHCHRYRMLMPLVFTQELGVADWQLHAIDTRDGVAQLRPVMRSPLHHGELRIHGSSAGILLLSSGNRLYACNPCTRRWARLPPLHVDHRIIGFYAPGDPVAYVLYHDRQEYDCRYWIFQVDAHPHATLIGRPGDLAAVGLDLVLANGIAPSYVIPPVHFHVYLCWPPQATRGTNDILMFDTNANSFSLIPPPTIQVGGEHFHVGVGAQLLVLHGRLAMAVISPARIVDVWVRSNMDDLWSRPYRIGMPVGAINAGVFAVAPDPSLLVQWPRILNTDHGVFLSRHTIQESLLLYPDILPLQDTDAVDDDPPFFQNH